MTLEELIAADILPARRRRALHERYLAAEDP
jgi:hypothetical protein